MVVLVESGVGCITTAERYFRGMVRGQAGSLVTGSSWVVANNAMALLVVESPIRLFGYLA